MRKTACEKHKYGTGLALLLLFFIFTIFTPDSVFAFSIGDKVKTTANLSVRSCALTTCSLTTTESTGSTGTISNGSYSGSGYTWWYINWDNGYSGYSVQDYLAAIPGSFTLSLTPECSGTTSQIRLNWTSSSNTTSYDVYRNGSLYYSGVTGTQFINTSVTAGTSYSYYVQAKNSNGSTNSSSVSATASNCSVTIPATPTNTSPGDTTSPGPTTSSATVSLSWSSSSGATYYGLGVRDIAAGTLVVDTNVTGTSYTPTLPQGSNIDGTSRPAIPLDAPVIARCCTSRRRAICYRPRRSVPHPAAQPVF